MRTRVTPSPCVSRLHRETDLTNQRRLGASRSRFETPPLGFNDDSITMRDGPHGHAHNILASTADDANRGVAAAPVGKDTPALPACTSVSDPGCPARGRARVVSRWRSGTA